MNAPILRYALDRSVRRSDGGRLLVGGMPPRLVRLTHAGALALDTMLAGFSLDSSGEALARRLDRDGLIHPLPIRAAAEPTVTTIIPSLDGGASMVALVRQALREGPVVVVDDGSSDDSAERAAAIGARVIANGRRRGPAGARNTGLRVAETDLVAFLDADCSAAPGWRRGLAGLFFADPGLAVLAPRVRSAAGPSPLARYERGNSPLDLGGAPSLVGPSRRISYLPAAALLARRATLLELGGFDEAMRFGEDVDLIWRLTAAGYRSRYVPAREVLHAPRPTLLSFAAQRAGYGAAAPDLASRHDGLASPLRVGAGTASIWAGWATLGLPGALVAIGAFTARAASRSNDHRACLALIEESLRGNVEATRHLFRAMSREWLPLSLAVAAVSGRARRLLLTALLVEITLARRRSPESSPIELAALCLVDHASYAGGLWRGSIRRGELGALRPRIFRRSDG